MQIIIALIIVFIISYFLIFKLIYNGNNYESKEEKLHFFLIIFVAFLLALLPTVTIALILFILLGSTSAIYMLFALHINTKQLILLTISLSVYLFSIDSIIEIIVKYIVGKNIFYYFTLLLIRTLASYTIGLAIGLNETNSFLIGAGVAFIIFLFEVLYHAKTKKVA